MARRLSRRAPRSHKRLEQSGPSLSAQEAMSSVVMARQVGRGTALALLFFSILLLVQFLTDARFKVRRIEVSGTSLIEQQDIQEQIALMGRPLFLVNTRHVEQELLQAFGCIERVRIKTRLPDEITIQIAEKDVIMVWESQGRYWWIAVDGQVLGETDDPGDLPILHDRSKVSVDPQEYIVGVPWEFVGEITQLLSSVRDWEFSLEDGLTVFVTANSWPVYLGFEGNPEHKAHLVSELATTLVERGSRVLYIDLKNEHRPAVKLESG